MFYIAAGINVFGMFFFLFLGSGTEQKWNRPEHFCRISNVSEDDAYDHMNPNSSVSINGSSNTGNFSNGVVKA